MISDNHFDQLYAAAFYWYIISCHSWKKRMCSDLFSKPVQPQHSRFVFIFFCTFCVLTKPDELLRRSFFSSSHFVQQFCFWNMSRHQKTNRKVHKICSISGAHIAYDWEKTIAKHITCTEIYIIARETYAQTDRKEKLEEKKRTKITYIREYVQFCMHRIFSIIVDLLTL